MGLYYIYTHLGTSMAIYLTGTPSKYGTLVQLYRLQLATDAHDTAFHNESVFR